MDTVTLRRGLGGQRYDVGADAVLRQVQYGGIYGQPRRVVVGYGHRYRYRRRVIIAPAGRRVRQRGRIIGGIGIGRRPDGYRLRRTPVARRE